jgi:uncharacterized protein YggE
MRNLPRFGLAIAMLTSLGVARGDVDFEYQPSSATAQRDDQARQKADAKAQEKAHAKAETDAGAIRAPTQEKGSASGEPERADDPQPWGGNGT